MWTKRLVLMAMVLVLGFVAAESLMSPVVHAHCDTLDGPVVTEARKALELGDVTPLLKWVNAEDEESIRAAFRHTLEIRRLNEEARVLADSYFFETLVRIHRAGEGEPYTGLKPLGTPGEPGVEVADTALETGTVDPLVQRLTKVVEEQVRHRFESVVAKQSHQDDSVEAGREYVNAYVEYVHYVQGLHEALAGGSHGHGEE